MEKKLIISCLDTFGGTNFGPKMKSVYCDASSLNWQQMLGWAYENHFS